MRATACCKPGGVSLRAEHECDEDAGEWRENGELVNRVQFGQVVRENCGDGVRLRPGETVEDLTNDLSGMHKVNESFTRECIRNCITVDLLVVMLLMYSCTVQYMYSYANTRI